MAGGESSTTAEPAVCPIDHKTREAWLEQARANAAVDNAQGAPAKNAATASVPSAPQAAKPVSSWSSWLWSQPSSPPLTNHEAPPGVRPKAADRLDTDRVVSSIPRTMTADGITPAAATNTAYPVNHEVETGADSASGNWIYPSEKMFFDAMKRKGNDNARVADMKVVVPIHNAVNERAWKEICEWEEPYTGAGPGQCGGPRLHSFSGLSSQMSPKARFNTLLGYSAPFDRHDWIVDRCGTQIEYVIDFYAGRPSRNPSQQQVSFYLDVRPKLNSWEGVKMRALRGLGLA